MKEMIEKAVLLIPRFLSEMLEVLVSPKPFLRQKQRIQANDIESACLFFGMTLLLAFAAQFSFIASWRENPVASLVSLTALTFLFVLLSLAVLRFSWFVVGGKATLRQLFVFYAYVTGPITVILVAFSIVSFLLLRLLDPAGFTNIVRNGFKTTWVPTSVGDKAFVAVALFGVMAALVWSVLAWGAFRELNSVSRRRSPIAFFIFLFLNAPLFFLASISSA